MRYGCLDELGPWFWYVLAVGVGLFLLVGGYRELRARWGQGVRRMFTPLWIMLLGAGIVAGMAYVTGYLVWLAAKPAYGSPDRIAATAGERAQRAEEKVRRLNSGKFDGRYASQLQDLLVFDKRLVADPAVTFLFGPCNSSGYSFTTTHARGSQGYSFSKHEPRRTVKFNTIPQ